MNQREAFQAGRVAGYNCATWIDTPEIGAVIWTESDGRVTIGERDSDGTLSPLDYVYSAAFEAESNGRQYSPFEDFASELNAAGDRSEGLWESYERGVASGIAKEIRNRKKNR